MNTQFVRPPRGSTTFYSKVLVLVFCLFLQSAVNAEIVELSITGYWSEGNFKVTRKSDQSYSPADPKFDGKVLGIAPSAGQVTVELLVSTDDSIFFPKGASTTAADGSAYTLAHNFYGYREVSLAGGTFSFGNAIWRTDGILARLEGPNRVQAALWTDVDITKEDPARVSFRMFGKAEGIQADLFVGSRTPGSIGGQFLLWEYYMGEEIRSKKYAAKRKFLP